MQALLRKMAGTADGGDGVALAEHGWVATANRAAAAGDSCAGRLQAQAAAE